MLPKPLANAIVVLVTLVWVANFVAQFVLPEYKPDPFINTIFAALVGGALALSKRTGIRDKLEEYIGTESDDEEKKSEGKEK